MLNVQQKIKARLRRHRRVRKTISGTPDRPRLVVFRSNMHIYAQIINDMDGKTLVSASTLDKECRLDIKRGSDSNAAKFVGQLVAKRALANNIKKVVFDRGGYLFHGRVKALAEAVRQAGLQF